MLRSCFEEDKLFNFNQASRKHHIRNLRAKVRALLPVQICTKHTRRNNKIIHVQERMNAYRSTMHSAKWSCCQMGKSQYFSSSEAAKGRHMFENLNLKQIEQINEDKFYFLNNEKNIKCYDQYVQQNYPQLGGHFYSSTQPTSHSHIHPPRLISTSIAADRAKSTTAVQTHNFSHSNLINSQKEFPNIQFQGFEFERGKSKISRDLKSRKVEINEEQRIKRQITAMTLEKKMHLADQKRTLLMSRRHQNLLHKGQLENQKLAKAFTFRQQKNIMTGEIISLTQQLRKVCLQRRLKENKNENVIVNAM